MIDNVKGVLGLFLRTALFHHCLHQYLSNTDASTSSSGHHDTLFSETIHIGTLGTQSTQNARQCRRASALNIIIEAQMIIAVLIQKILCLIRRKVLKLH